MGYINQPPDLRIMFDDIYKRLRLLETAQRFTAPDIATVPTYPRTGDIIFNSTKGYLEYWNGSAWVDIADSNLSTPLTTVNATLKTVNNNLTYTGNPCTITSQRIGKMITAFANIVGTTVTSWGTGQIYFLLPAGFPTFAHQIIASGAIVSGGNTYTIFGVIAQGDNKMYLWSPTSNGGSDAVTYNKPTTLGTGSTIVINGVAILA